METLPFFLFRVWGSMVYTLLSGPMVYTLFPCFPRKLVYTIAFFALWPRGGERPRKESGKKNDININFLVRISRGHSRPLRPDAQGSKSFSHHRGRRKTHFRCGRPRFSARTSMTRRVVEKLCTKKVCVYFLAPKEGSHGGGVYSFGAWSRCLNR